MDLQEVERMKELPIGRILVENRHRLGITQEQLAASMGVSKASVSKWETAVTYPDITLLPQLAAFFNISMDELMGYSPQLSKADIRKLYRELSMEFASRSFDEAVKHCREIQKRYFSCAPLVFHIGVLYVNHSMLAGSPEKTAQILEEAGGLFARVRADSGDPELAKEALLMEALCLLNLGGAREACEMLEPLEISLVSVEPLLAKAYQSTGNVIKAKQILQVGIYRSICELLSFLSSYMGACLEDGKSFEETWQRITCLETAFHLDVLHPGLLLTSYLLAAQGFMALGRQEKALDLLERYAALAESGIYPLRLRGDSYLNLLDDWLEDVLTLGGDPPRDENLVRKSMAEAVADNPAFAPLAQNDCFQNILRRLKVNGEG